MKVGRVRAQINIFKNLILYFLTIAINLLRKSQVQHEFLIE